MALISSLTPIAWRLADAEQAVEITSKALWAQIVNDDLNTLDELRAEAGLA